MHMSNWEELSQLDNLEIDFLLLFHVVAQYVSELDRTKTVVATRR